MDFPNVILPGNGSQYVSQTMGDFTEMLSIAESFSSIYHAASNGIIERFHKCLKHMLYKMTSDFPNDWDKYLPAVFFAFNETHHRVTGHFSHELFSHEPFRYHCCVTCGYDLT